MRYYNEIASCYYLLFLSMNINFLIFSIAVNSTLIVNGKEEDKTGKKEDTN